MSTKTKTLAKSLHTVTVLTRVALHALEWKFVDDETPERAVTFAANLLGYGDADDPYDLCGAAVEAVRKALPKPVAEPAPTWTDHDRNIPIDEQDDEDELHAIDDHAPHVSYL